MNIQGSHYDYQVDTNQRFLNAFPEVVDVMVRILTTEGESAIKCLKKDHSIPSEYSSPGEYWWDLAERNSEVYMF